MCAPALLVENLSFGYQPKDDLVLALDLRIDPGEFVGLIGPNGSGKTTLIGLLSRSLAPKGLIEVNGDDTGALTAKEMARRIAVVPQSLDISFSFNVRELVAMGRTPHLKRFEGERPADRLAIEKAMKATRIGDLANRKVKELSGGEIQRVIIAQALAQEAGILLLDEPTAHLDIGYQLEIMELISELSEGGITVLAVIHDLNLAAAYFKRLVFLRDGRVIADGPTEEVFNSANIQQTFSTPNVVHKNPMTGRLFTTLSGALGPEGAQKRGRIHIISGSGSGAAIMKELSHQGYNLSAGVLNVLDSDEEAARSLGIITALEAPFSSISKEAFVVNKELVDESKVVIISNVCVGKGNFKNLIFLQLALRAGKRVIIVEETPIEERDFVGGRFKDLTGELIREGAVRVGGRAELMEVLKSWGEFV
ncbi:MAG: ABC transporter ATP-binding protein [Actinomycetota bacterium]|nr:ABC transporter ATP-binding protein [Actinomycetota bacterium]